MKPIYLDNNASTPLAPEVAEVMKPYLEEYFGNPSSTHWYGLQTKMAVEKARKQIAGLLGCDEDEIVFTSGGSESNNYAIKGAAFANQHRGKHIITSVIEHPAVSEVCRYLEKQGFEISWLPVDEFGLLNPAEVEKAIRPDTILISVMHANNEIGTIQPIKEIAKLARDRNILMHCDAAQSIGKIPVNVDEMGVDMLSVAAHKFYGPKGIGALYIRRGVTLEKFVHGADHERNLRAGTENVLEIAGLGKACEIARQNMKKRRDHVLNLRDRLHEGLKKNIKDVRLNGHPEKRLPNTLNLSFPGVEANILLDELDDIAASAGAACHSETVDVSPTIEAIRLAPKYAMGTIRFSTGRFNTEEEIDRAISLISTAVLRLRGDMTGADTGENSLDIDSIKLTHYTQGLGCACKLRPQALEKILKDLPHSDAPEVLVGNDTSDDAAVYKISDELAIVQTVDFFTPVVDDPYDFGRIAAANALSDIYAMGAKPLFALNIVGFPSNRLPMDILKRILEGAQDKAEEAGISILGGHTIDDPEPKFGMAVNGIIHPDKLIRNSEAKVGDVLILTKPLGLGILSTALKRGVLEKRIIDQAVNIMSTLNKVAAECMQDFPVSACTDVTGFGLLGHLKEMLKASGVDAEIYSDKVPVMEKVHDLIAAGIVPGGTLNNLDYVEASVKWASSLSKTIKIILCDAQTSGGLLIALPENEGKNLEQRLKEVGVESAKIIGKISAKGSGKILVI